MAVFDLILLVVLILCIVVGMRRGFIMTLCGLLAIVIALVGAKAAADQFSPMIEKAITPRIESVVTVQLNESVKDTVEDTTGWENKDANGENSGILGILQQSETYQAAVSAIQDSIAKGMESTMQTAAGSMAKEIAHPLSWGVVYVIAFLVILLLWNLISKALDLVAKLPVLHFFNRLLGGAFGLIKGVIIVGGIAWLILSLGLLPQATIQESIFLRFFSGFTTTSI